MSKYIVTNPATGASGPSFTSATDAEVVDAIGAADRAYSEFSRHTSVAERAALMQRVADLHSERRGYLADLIVREMGKPREVALGEVDFAADIYGYYAGHGEEFLADEPIELRGGQGSAFMRNASLGVLLGVMPWNFPYYQVARFAGPNLVLGNTILLKHASQCPESAAAIEQIFADSGFPVGAYRTLYVSSDQVADIIADPRVCGVSLTGSEGAGAAVAEVAGRNLKKVVLELGGSDPFILLSTDNFNEAVDAAVAARVINSGQACNAAKRFIVVDDLFDAFVEAFTQKIGDIVPADPTLATTTMGPLSSLGAAENLEEQLHRAEAQGATIVLRGQRDGAFYSPSVLTGVSAENDAYREEFFGPVAAIYRVDDEAQAIQVANDIPFGLSCFLFTTDEVQALRVADQIQAGMLFINGTLLDAAELPFGGVKRSGFGREQGRLGIAEFANKKLIRILK